MVIWKNVDLKKMGIIVEKSPVITKAKKRFETFDIEGRDGVLTVDKGTYESFLASIECHFDTEKANIDRVKELLDGYGTLSFDGQREYTATIQNQIDFEKILQFRKFIIQFLVNPIAYDINANSYFMVRQGTITLSKGNYKTNPKIIIRGSGNISLTINNKTFYLYDLDDRETYTLDCAAKVIFDSQFRNCSHLMKYDFPYLIPGDNDISWTGNVSSVIIDVKEAYL